MGIAMAMCGGLPNPTVMDNSERRVRQWFWLSYTQGGEFESVAIVAGVDWLDAVARARMMGIAPGSLREGVEVMGWPFKAQGLVRRWGNRRLSREEAEELGAILYLYAREELGELGV